MFRSILNPLSLKSKKNKFHPYKASFVIKQNCENIHAYRLNFFSITSTILP